uniref:Glutamate decarboxylase 2 n=1 Tax=Chrysemys picta bellii TaxID=8478 RepID=A0A8C3HQD0_CHRPI
AASSLPLSRSPRGAPGRRCLSRHVMDILLQYVVKSFDRSTKVIDFHYPNELLQEYNWELADQPQTLEEILLNCRTTLKYAIKTGHPRYFNQLSTGLDMVGLAADWLTSTANTNMFTYEIAPVFVLLEYVTLRKMREMIGWPGGCGDGIFSPGGAISNMYAMLIARFKMFPEVKEKGMAAIPRLVAFTSEHSHFSVKKGAAALGIGTDSVILIRCDERGKIIPSDLERRIIEAKQKGFVPFLVSATAGTTVYGAFDPLLAIADICKKYKIWMHVDAAWGGGLLMSRKHKWKLNGVERANSVTWNPHKMMGVPLQCSALLVREEVCLHPFAPLVISGISPPPPPQCAGCLLYNCVIANVLAMKQEVIKVVGSFPLCAPFFFKLPSNFLDRKVINFLLNFLMMSPIGEFA